MTCMVYVLRECGEWPEALELGRELIASGTAVWVAEGLVGVIHAVQGKLSSARRLLSSSLATASQVGHFNMSVDTTTGLARVAAAEGARRRGRASAAARCSRAGSAARTTTTPIKGLRWGAGFFARQGDLQDAQACAEALTRISSETGHADALAALAHAIGETALADGDAETAAEQLGHAVELHRGLDLPFERAEIELRAGVALAAAGEREPALERLGDAYRTARKLGARPLAAEAARRGGGARRVGGPRASAAARPPTPTGPACRAASSRSCASSPSGAPTARSPRSCSSARAPWTCTCATSCASSTAARASRPPTGRASSACWSRRGLASAAVRSAVRLDVHPAGLGACRNPAGPTGWETGAVATWALDLDGVLWRGAMPIPGRPTRSGA